MGQKQDQLTRLLDRHGAVTHGVVAFPTMADLAESNLIPEIDAVYRALGGVLDHVPLNLRKWDLEFDGAAVELDEQLHFNRYRAITLESPLYELLPGFPRDLYQTYCREQEDDCLSAGGYGGKWSNRSCDAQFGLASPPKVFSGVGPSRWKQRAFYDFVKDLSPLLLGITVSRVSVWDWIEHEQGPRRTVQDALSRPSPTTGIELAALIRSRGVTKSSP